MAYTPLRVSIPAPCSQSWNDMPPTSPNRRHCASCAKHVTDFSWMTDREIHQYFRRHGGKLCGRFRADQLDRPIRAYVPPATGWKWLAAAGGLLLSVGMQGQAMGEYNSYCGEPPTPSVLIDGRAAIGTEVVGSLAPATYRGLVVDEKGEPLIGASVVVAGRTTRTMTDSNGSFTLNLKPGADLLINYSDFYPRTIRVEQGDAGFTPKGQQVVVQSNEELLGEVILADYVTPEHLPAIEVSSDSLSEVKAEEVATVSLVQAFPNPFVNDLSITFTAEAPGTIRAELFDLHGRVVRRWPAHPFGTGQVQLPFPLGQRSLPAGEYLLRMTDQAGAVESLVVVKQ